ncbi:MAG: damage-control phosphatase ARMT1 family protein [Chloroflexi bacterium]|nr:damage-control phosphatase ARMT1 family protein [Chloroflexota bacterium]
MTPGFYSQLPPLLMTSEPGSFAQRTLAERDPRILDGIVERNEYPSRVVHALQDLRRELTHGVIRPLREPAPDREYWDLSAAKHVAKSWLAVPWYWAEAFFYRRILEAVEYFQPGDLWRRDPFVSQKNKELEPAAAPAALDAVISDLSPDRDQALRTLVYGSLWGNRTDLSYAQARGEQSVRDARGRERENILVDDAGELLDYVRAKRRRIHFICDNAGPELLFDLALAESLLRFDVASDIVLHLKPQPFFVSDAMVADVHAALEALRKSGMPRLVALAGRLQDEMRRGRLALLDHSFWVTAELFRQIPQDLRSRLANSDLVVVKGDANYRRLVGDCHWDPVTPFDDTVGYFPAPVAALRTLKAELIVGLQAGHAEQLDRQDRDWRVNGKRGVIQFWANQTAPRSNV